MQQQQKAAELEETNSKLEMVVSQLRMQLNEATGELDFSRNFMQLRRGDEDFNQERETLFQRIVNVQN